MDIEQSQNGILWVRGARFVEKDSELTDEVGTSGGWVARIDPFTRGHHIF